MDYKVKAFKCSHVLWIVLEVFVILSDFSLLIDLNESLIESFGIWISKFIAEIEYYIQKVNIKY